MAIAVEMPKMSDTMEEGVLVAWLVDEGCYGSDWQSEVWRFR